MSTLKNAVNAIQQALKLADDVKAMGGSLKEVATELKEHDRRLTRLEAKWETAMEFAAFQADRRSQLETKE